MEEQKIWKKLKNGQNTAKLQLIQATDHGPLSQSWNNVNTKTCVETSVRKTNSNNTCNATKFPVGRVKLAAAAIRLQARLRSADMPITMQERALSFTSSFVDANSTTRLNPCHLACALKKEFDTRYGAVWHCIVGKSYGSYVTHSNEGFLYFSFDSLSILLFQTQVHLANC